MTSIADTTRTAEAPATPVIALTTPLDLIAMHADQVGIRTDRVLELHLDVDYDLDTHARFFRALFHTSDGAGWLALVDGLNLTVQLETPDTATVAYAVGTLIDGTAVTVCCLRSSVHAAAAVTA